MRSYLDFDGVYDPSRRFAFTNITDEDFTSYWDKNPIVVKPHQTVTLPHHLALKMTGELVDKIMLTDVKMNEMKYYEEHPGTPVNTYRAPNAMGVPAARKVWEDKILRELEHSEETPEVQALKAQIKEELIRDMSKLPGVPDEPMPASIQEFADMGKTTENAPKKGRPKKSI